MSYSKEDTNNYLLYDTPIENIFIAVYAKSAPEDYLKVYLLAYMHASMNGNFSEDDLCKTLGVGVDTVRSAWDYWEQQGLVKVKCKDAAGRYNIEFISMKEKLLSIKEVPGVVSANSKKLLNMDFSEMFKKIESITSRLLEPGEPEAVASWVTQLSLSSELILYAYEYCTSKASSNRYRYVEKVLLAWRDRGIKTRQDATQYLKENDKHYDFYKTVLGALGLYRNPTAAEMEIMDVWMDRCGYSVDEVLNACKKTTGISNPNINYVNKILLDKYQKENLEDAQKSYASVEEIYEKIREENKAKTEANRGKIFSKIPGLKEVCDNINSSRLRLSRLMMRGSSKELEDTNKLISQLISKRDKLLGENGFAKEDIDQVYSCKKCEDTGLLPDGITRCSCYADKLDLLR